MMRPEEIRQQRQALLQQLRSASDLAAAVDYLHAQQQQFPGLQLKDGNLPAHFFEDFFSFKGNDDALLREKRLHEFLDSLALSCAPRLSEQFSFVKKGGCSVLHVDGIPESGIHTQSDAVRDLSDRAVENFIKDLECLADAGWFHPWALETSEHWYVHPTEGRVLLFAWDCIRPIESSEKARIRRSIATLCLGSW